MQTGTPCWLHARILQEALTLIRLDILFMKRICPHVRFTNLMWEVWPDEKSGIQSAESDCPRAEETNVAVAGTYSTP